MPNSRKPVPQPVVRALIYGTLLLLVAAVGAGGMGLGYQVGQEGNVQAYYQGAYDSCMGWLVLVFQIPLGSAQGGCLGYTAGMHKNGWHLVPPAKGWNWEFISGEK